TGLRVFRVITREDIKRLLQLEQTRQRCTGKIDAACMAEIGGALGVDFLVYGEVARVGGTYSLSLVMLDIGRAEAANRVNRKIRNTSDLLAETERASIQLVQPLLSNKRGFLVLDIPEAGAKVTVDGRVVGVTPLTGRLPLTMGAHEVIVEKEGFLAWARTVDVSPNQAAVEQVALVPSEDFIADYQDRAQTLRTSAWITAGSGAALLATSLALKLVSDARFDDLVSNGFVTRNPTVCAATVTNYDGESFCPTQSGYENGVLGTLDSIETMDTVSLVTVLVGGAAAITSAVLFIAGEDPSKYEIYGEGQVQASNGPRLMVTGRRAGLEWTW
ncbi:MAG: PEGA domain-containing protein, partial [Myxococcota bacterium]